MNLIAHIFRFIFLVLAQVLIFNHLNFNSGLIYPQVYILFLIMLPMEQRTWLTILIGFFLGLLIDLSQSTLGMHAFACATLAYVKPAILNFLSPREGYDFNSKPTITDQGVVWFMSYAGILAVIHHACLFMIEKYSWLNFIDSFLKIVLSALCTVVISVVFQLIFNPPKVKS